MAVYTHITHQQFTELLDQYDIGNLVSFKGVAEGVSNTNYLLKTDKDSYIATIYEKSTDCSHLPFYWGLMEHLHGDGIPCPVPIKDKKGEILKTVDGCPFAIVSFLKGKWPKNIRNIHCMEVGKIMARMHISARSFDQKLANPLSVDAWNNTYNGMRDKVAEVFSVQVADEISQALEYIKQHWPEKGRLPDGVIHGDLFPDNVFFQADVVSGLLDFYLSCNDLFAYDVAITLNAWCFEHGTEFNITKARALLKGYNQVKPFTENELEALPVLCVGASMRFLVSRLYDYLYQVEGAVVNVKDPSEYLKKLRFHLQVKKHGEYGL